MLTNRLMLSAVTERSDNWLFSEIYRIFYLSEDYSINIILKAFFRILSLSLSKKGF